MLSREKRSGCAVAEAARCLEGFKLARIAAAAADASEARLGELQSQVLAAVQSLEGHRLALETLMDQETAEFRETIVPLMDGVEAALVAGRGAAAIDLLGTLNLELGSKLDWSTLPEFDGFMADHELPLQL